MTEEIKIDEDVVAALREELNSQVQALQESMVQMKDHYEEVLSAKTEEINELTTKNKALQSDLVRHALNPTPAPAQKTEEDVYHDLIESRAKLTIEMMKGLR